MHSTASDGELSPEALLKRAQAAGIDALAITDHDTVLGNVDALQRLVDPLSAAAAYRLYSGVELSSQWAGCNIHVLGLGFRLDSAPLLEGLRRLAQARLERAAIIAQRLEREGFPGALEGARMVAGSGQLGRPHFARWLVQQGHVPDTVTAFDRYLGRNKLGDVKACWPGVAEVTAWICAAGGIAVLAHPLKYRFTAMKLGRLLRDFMAAGGSGIEVLSGRQEPGQTTQLLRLAERFSLMLSVGSDFHRDAPFGPALGVESAAFDAHPNVWQTLLQHVQPLGESVPCAHVPAPLLAGRSHR